MTCLKWILPALGLLLLTGCQCCPVTEKYCDAVDDHTDRKVCLDRLYNPKLDLSRINMCDGIRCCR